MVRKPTTKNDQGMKLLYRAIIVQAILDYRTLIDKNKNRIVTDRAGSFSRSELKKFFLGEWCRELVEASGFNYDGTYILNTLLNDK